MLESNISFKPGELSRTYSSQDTTKHMTNLQLSALISHAVAPLSPLLFKWIDFKLFGLEINQYNFIGIFMVIVTITYQLFVYFCLTNLTKEPGYQVFLKLEDKHDENSGSDENLNTKSLSLKAILLDIDIILILFGVFVTSFLYSQFEIYITILTITKFHWDIQYLGMVTVICITISAVLMKLLGKMNSQIDVIFLFIIVQMTFCFLMNLMCIPLSFDIQNRALQVGFFTSTFILYLVAGYNNRVLSSSLLFMVAPMSSRCAIVGVQAIMLVVSLGTGYFSASSIYEHGSIVYPIFAMLILISSILQFLRSQSFLEKYGALL